ncbi:MAG: hypothetical protein QOG04_2066 [Actinomycetota bacterium]|nr:hypothetical protein [Actinomycetota bacterium]
MAAEDEDLESEETVDLAEADADEIEEEEAALATDEDDEESDEASLEELLAQRASARKGSDESEDEDDIMALSSEKDTAAATALPSKVIPIKDQEEFVCKSCYLVKARSQLADEKRMYCRDCA